MDGKKSIKFWCKITCLIFFGLINFALFIISLNVSYEDELIKEHMRFRTGFPTQINWKASPQGKLNCYLFNVTNSEEFMMGTDKKLKLNQIGPISYRVRGKHDNLHINDLDSTMTYRKHRYEEVIFDPESSCSPDILNQTVITPNFVLLSAAARLHDWFILLRSTFSAISAREPIFINRTVYEFLWNFTTPILERVAPYIPSIEQNAGMLHNAIRSKVEEFNVNIGLRHGLKNFFRINKMNNRTFFAEHSNKIHNGRPQDEDEWCPVDVQNSFDNSVFPPYLTPNDELSFVAGDSCRIFLLTYDRNMSMYGFDGFRYIIRDTSDMPSCLDESSGIPLHKGMFDVTNCIFSVPTAFSFPHFFGSSYNWSEHFEGLSPNADDHETFILIQPKTGVPFEEIYRFQSNIPMPDMDGFSKDIQRFSKMIIPSFWYEYDLDELPASATLMMHFTLDIAPIIQPICIIVLLVLSLMCFISAHRKLTGTNRFGSHLKLFRKSRKNAINQSNGIELNTYIDK